MKKLILSIVLLTVTGTSFGMNNDGLIRSLLPYAKIGIGLGCIGFSAWLSLKDTNNANQGNIREDSCENFMSPSIKIGNVPQISKQSGASVLSPQFAISAPCLAAVMTFIPGLLLMKSGLNDLQLEKAMLLAMVKKQSN